MKFFFKHSNILLTTETIICIQKNLSVPIQGHHTKVLNNLETKKKKNKQTTTTCNNVRQFTIFNKSLSFIVFINCGAVYEDCQSLSRLRTKTSRLHNFIKNSQVILKRK